MSDPDLLAAIHDLHTAIATLTDELRQHRQAGQEGIEAIVALHQQQLSIQETEHK